tara:strand:- start:706 stop:960 length:255 start_codon:yes stop_codon:yes gene_type:complete
MTTQEVQNYIAPILKEIYVELYGNSSSVLNRRIGWGTYSHRAELTVLSADLEEAIELIEMNNLAYTVNPSQYVTGKTNIIISYK